jgi:hypothetical protein
MNQLSARRSPQIVLAIGLALHALFLASLPTGFLNGLFVEASQGHGQASDLFGIYQAGANLIHGYSIYDSADYRHEAPQAVPYFYFYRYLPPTAYVAGLAAALLAPWTAYWLWVIVNELMMAALVWAVLRDRRWPIARRQVAAGLWLGCFPFYIEQFMGQFSFTMAALLYLLWRWDASNDATTDDATTADAAATTSTPAVARLGPRAREWLVTAVWAASVTLKTYTVMLAAPYLRDRLWRRIAAGAALGIAVCAPYFMLRPADVREFLRLNLSPFMAIYKGAFGLQTALRDFVSHLPAAITGWSFPLAGRTLTFERLALPGISAAIVLLGLWATLRWSRAPHRRTLDLALWTTAFFLIFKSVWEYHYVMMLPVVTALYCTYASRAVLVLAIWLCLPTLYAAAPALAGVSAGADLAQWPGWFRVLHFHAKALPTVLVFLWLLGHARDDHGPCHHAAMARQERMHRNRA